MPYLLTLYHGSPSAIDVLEKGLKLRQDPSTQRDPGDFGRGVYLTRYLPRARSYGDVLACRVVLMNPLVFTTAEEAYDVVEHRAGSPCRGPAVERQAASQRWTDHVRRLGYDSVVIHHPHYGRYWEVVCLLPDVQIRKVALAATPTRVDC